MSEFFNKENAKNVLGPTNARKILGISKEESMILEACLHIQKSIDIITELSETEEEDLTKEPILNHDDFLEMVRIINEEDITTASRVAQDKINFLCNIIDKKVWKPCSDDGHFYKLEEKELLCVPMNNDGSMDMDGGEPNVVQVCISAFTEEELGVFLYKMSQFFGVRQSEILRRIEY